MLASKFGKQDDGKTTTFKGWKFRKYGKDDDEKYIQGITCYLKFVGVYDDMAPQQFKRGKETRNGTKAGAV